MGALIAVAPAIEGSGEQSALFDTSDATLTLIAELIVPNSGALLAIVKYVACDATAANSFSGNVSATARAPGGIATLESPEIGDGFIRLSTGWSIGLPTSRPSVTFVGGVDKYLRIYAKGRAATNIYWTFKIEFVEVSTP